MAVEALCLCSEACIPVLIGVDVARTLSIYEMAALFRAICMYDHEGLGSRTYHRRKGKLTRLLQFGEPNVRCCLMCKHKTIHCRLGRRLLAIFTYFVVG